MCSVALVNCSHSWASHTLARHLCSSRVDFRLKAVNPALRPQQHVNSMAGLPSQNLLAPSMGHSLLFVGTVIGHLFKNPPSGGSGSDSCSGGDGDGSASSACNGNSSSVLRCSMVTQLHCVATHSHLSCHICFAYILWHVHGIQMLWLLPSPSSSHRQKKGELNQRCVDMGIPEGMHGASTVQTDGYGEAPFHYALLQAVSGALANALEFHGVQ